MPKAKQKTLHVDEPKAKFVWKTPKEESLWEIVEHGENGRLKKKIVNDFCLASVIHKTSK